MKNTIAPHITVQPMSGRAITSVATPAIGIKINNPITTLITKPITQGFKHLLQLLKKLFIYFAPSLSAIITSINDSARG